MVSNIHPLQTRFSTFSGALKSVSSASCPIRT
uniref:Uncharacterized protein n=1 Tax=Anguilla anguilla TaxID=7936 RepID=A0A0E9V8E0_ANGAN